MTKITYSRTIVLPNNEVKCLKITKEVSCFLESEIDDLIQLVECKIKEDNIQFEAELKNEIQKMVINIFKSDNAND